MCNESDNNPHVDYDDDDDDDNDCGTVTFLGVSRDSSLGSEEVGRGVRVHCTLMEMVSTLTRNNVMNATPLIYHRQKSKDKVQPSMTTVCVMYIFTPHT
jgi:hypothetical protein